MATRTANTASRRGRTRLFAALAVILGLVLAACGGDDGGDDAADAATGDGGTGKITIGWIPWDEDIAVTHLWKHLLEEQGYEVELTNVDAAPLFQGLADGDIDLFLDGWLPDTHSDYWEEHGDSLEQVGVWFDNASLSIAVPDYVEIDSLADLADEADTFGGRIVGIEPGAGLMRVTGDDVMPTYGLDDFQLLEGSTPTMLTELQTAIENEEPIVVTLWHPHWAYAKFPIRDLEDPEGALGTGEEIFTLANKDFAAANPEVIGWLKNFKMDDESLGSLEDLVLNVHEGDEAAGVEAWLEDSDNAALAQSWIDG